MENKTRMLIYDGVSNAIVDGIIWRIDRRNDAQRQKIKSRPIKTLQGFGATL